MNIVPADISTVPAAGRSRVLWLLLSDLEETARIEQITRWLEAAKQQPEMFIGLFQARRAGQLVGAVWAQILLGQVGVLWVPRLVANEVPETGQALIDTAKELWSRHETRFVQVVLAENDEGDEQVLRQANFALLTELDYMACTLDEAALAANIPFTIEAFQPRQRKELLALLSETYVDTLDCPEMDDVRPLDEVLDGYESTGQSGCRFWYLATAGGKLAGCLLLADHQTGDFELVYVGLAKPFRGRGWGKVLTQFGQHVASSNGGQRLLLAVDHRNLPAINIYRQQGFSKLCRRRVWKWENSPDTEAIKD